MPYFIPAFVDLDSPRYSFYLIYGIMRHKAPFMNEPFAKVIGDEVVLTDKDGFSTDKLPVRYPLTLFTLALECFLMAEGLSAADVEIGGDSLTVYRDGEVFRRIPPVEGFSALAEELSAGQLVSLMNEYPGAMTEVFQAKAGTLDKYFGDAIVTMFGMPVPVEDYASRACLAAIEMQERHAALREKWAASGEWPENVVGMRTRIGPNTGVAVIGNMGSDMRFNYTMMGDSVNLAAHCESGAKSYGVYTMVTGNTLMRALEEGAQLHYRKLDRVIVKGRSQPVDLFELWEPSVPSDQSLRCKEAYKAALAQRCRDFLEKGKPAGWDGAYSMETK